jgi:hypothetical protein
MRPGLKRRFLNGNWKEEEVKTTQTQVDKRCGGRFKEVWCEMMEDESIG